MSDHETYQQWPSWLMLWLSVFIIIFWIITVCSPSIFWKFMDIILWFFLLAGGTSAVINAFRNKGNEFAWLLWIGGLLLALIGIWLIFSWSQLVWTIMIWIFALWALVRWITMIIFGISNKENQSFRWAIFGLWCLLFILAIVIIASDKTEARTLAWRCIWISTILDWISLLAFALKMKNNSTLQSELLSNANQHEIAQWNIVMTETVVISNSIPNNQESSESSQINEK